MPPLHSTVHLSDSTSELIIHTLPHILTKCSLNKNMRTRKKEVTKQQSKVFKDVKEYLETPSKPKMLMKLTDKGLILKRDMNRFTFSRFNSCPYTSQVSEVFKYNPPTFQVLYKPSCLCPVSKKKSHAT